jgi:membrane associated rhomboid family serine protease
MIPIRDDVHPSGLPLVTAALIAANTAIFIYSIVLGPEVEAFVHRYAVVPRDLFSAVRSPLAGYHAFGTLFSSLFLHGSLLHLGGNMIYLWVFGRSVESRLGYLRFLVFYIASGVAASLTHAAFFMDSAVPLIGASGAIAGVLGAYFFLYPLARVHVVIPLIIVFPILRLPALVYLGGWFAIQVWSGYTAAYHELSTGIAWWAHAGGFAAGAVLLIFFLPVRRY